MPSLCLSNNYEKGMVLQGAIELGVSFTEKKIVKFRAQMGLEIITVYMTVLCFSVK